MRPPRVEQAVWRHSRPRALADGNRRRGHSAHPTTQQRLPPPPVFGPPPRPRGRSSATRALITGAGTGVGG
eukprot:scaffold6299_cov109-Isochrysis_galbana.AAC.3